MISWKLATNQLKERIPLLEGEDNPADILFICYCEIAMSIKEIAAICNVSPFTLRRKLVSVGIKPKERGGSRKRKAVFSEEDLKELSLKELSLKYKVSTTTVCKARRVLRAKSKG